MVEIQKNAGSSWVSSCSQSYGYDKFGNRTITGVSGGVNGLNLSYDFASNWVRISPDSRFLTLPRSAN